MVEAGDGNVDVASVDVASVEVTVIVANVNEPGTVTLSTLQPQPGVTMMAMLTDPDGTLSETTWQWARSLTRRGNYSNISGTPTDGTYRVTDDDVDMYLRATVTYTDAERFRPNDGG